MRVFLADNYKGPLRLRDSGFESTQGTKAVYDPLPRVEEEDKAKQFRKMCTQHARKNLRFVCHTTNFEDVERYSEDMIFIGLFVVQDIVSNRIQAMKKINRGK